MATRWPSVATVIRIFTAADDESPNETLAVPVLSESVPVMVVVVFVSSNVR